MTIKKMYGFDHLVGSGSQNLTHGFFSDLEKITTDSKSHRVEAKTVGGKTYSGYFNNSGSTNFHLPEVNKVAIEKMGLRITGENIHSSTIKFLFADKTTLVDGSFVLSSFVPSGLQTAYIEVEFAPPAPEFPSNRVVRFWVNGVPVKPEQKKYAPNTSGYPTIPFSSLPGAAGFIFGDIYYGIVDEASADLYPLGSVVIKSSVLDRITEPGNLVPVDLAVGPKEELSRFLNGSAFKSSYCMLNKKGTVSEISFPALTEKPLFTKISLSVSKGLEAVEKIKVTPVDKTGDLTTVEHAPTSLTSGDLESVDLMFPVPATLEDSNAFKVKVGY